MVRPYPCLIRQAIKPERRVRIRLPIQPTQDDEGLSISFHLGHDGDVRIEINAHEFGHETSSRGACAGQQTKPLGLRTMALRAAATGSTESA